MPELAIYLHTYLRVSFHCSGVNNLRAHSALVLHEQTRKAATRFVWTAVILSSSETTGPFQTVGHLKCTIKQCISNLLEVKGGFA